MSRRRGFTLLELLVVIAIIVLLMAILLPALSRVRKQAKDVICQTQLKQWGEMFSMYAEDHNGYFSGYNKEGHDGSWIVVMRPYYREQGGITCCPMAADKGKGTGWGGDAFRPWGPLGMEAGGLIPGDYGSYGINGWIHNPGADPINKGRKDTLSGKVISNFWGSPSVRGAADIPLFMDCAFFHGWPMHFDPPAESEAGPFSHSGSHLANFCINRHDGTVDGVFLDWTVRKIRLKQLWRFKWHRSFSNTDPSKNPWLALPGDIPSWPEWMKKFKEYY